MSFAPLLVPWPPQCILRDTAEVLVIDKPAGWVVHGGDEKRRDDVVSRLHDFLEQQGRATYLAVHQRLDRDASGVLLFVRNAELNATVAKAFSSGDIERRYQAVVRGSLPSAGTLEDRLETGADGLTRVVTEGGRPASTAYRVVGRAGERALVELSPATGRTHQLRAQLAHHGAPICGDRLYGGEPAPRLMLHATELGIDALGEHTAVECPTLFREWLETGSVRLGSVERLERALSVAASARFGIAREATAFRVADDAADDLPGVTIDRYGDFAVLSTTSEEAFERRHEIAELIVGAGVRGVYEKHHPRADLRRLPAESVAPREPLAGSAAPPDVIVQEGALKLLVRLDEGLSTGLFCDQRDNRVRVQALARGARFLNLFSYTCSFTASAVLGGAVESVSVDVSAKALDRGRRNLQLNGAAGPEHRLVRADAVEWIARARRRAERFDLIVLDPPTFGTRGRRTFTVARDYEPLAADALSLLSPGGRLLAVTNHRKTQRSALRRILHGAARKAGRRVAQMKDLPPPVDYPHWPGGDEPVKSVLVTVS